VWEGEWLGERGLFPARHALVEKLLDVNRKLLGLG
jgi:hypothetical protein